MSEEFIRPSWVLEIDNLDEWEKLRAYGHYVIRESSLRHSFDVVDTKYPPRGFISRKELGIPWNHGHGVPDKMVGNLAFYYLWKDIRIMDYAEWVDPNNIRVSDMGEKWKESGYAMRFLMRSIGIYKWFKCGIEQKQAA